MKNVGNQMVDVANEFHGIFSPYYGSQWVPETVWLPAFFRISSFVLNRPKKLLLLGVEQFE